MSKAVVIFDEKGHIWAVNYGETNLPQGLKALLLDIPENVQSIDGINVEKGNTPIYSYIPQAQTSQFDAQISAFMARLTDVTDSINRATSIFSENLTDAQALRVPQYYVDWSGDDILYEAGQRVNYKGSLWKVLSTHRSQSNWTPEYSPSLFVKVINPDDGSVHEWVQPSAENAYMRNDIVRKNGKMYKSLVDHNVWEPGISGTESLWEVVDGR